MDVNNHGVPASGDTANIQPPVGFTYNDNSHQFLSWPYPEFSLTITLATGSSNAPIGVTDIQARYDGMTPSPEPATLGLFGGGLALLAIARQSARRR